MNFYNIYVKLCKEIGKKPSPVAVEAGLSKPTVNRWKNGGGCTDANLETLSAYFTKELGRPITVSYLKGEEPEQPVAREPTSMAGIQRMSDDELLEYAKDERIALYGGEKEGAIDREALELAALHKMKRQISAQKEKAASPATDSQKEEALHLIEEIKQKSPEDYTAAISYLRFLAGRK